MFRQKFRGAAPRLKLADIETYVKDDYVRKSGVGTPFKRVLTVVAEPKLTTLGAPNATPLDPTVVTTDEKDPRPSAYPNQNRATVYNVSDYSVSQIALTPRKSDLSDWQLPTGTLAANQSAATISGGRISPPTTLWLPQGLPPVLLPPQSRYHS